MLQNKVAVITGGASGIGEAAARLFVKEGARVVLGDVQVDKAKQLAAELGEQRAFVVECDVRQEEDIERLVQAAVDKFGGLDIMCNNAGIDGNITSREALMEYLDTAMFDKTLQINLRGVVLGTKHAARAMKAAGTRGCIINTASVAGIKMNVATHGDPVLMSGGYGAAKHAVVALTQLGACELCPYGIRVNAVAPGWTATPMVANVLGMGDVHMEEVECRLAELSVMKGVPIRAVDVAKGMLYLASEMGDRVNGHTLVIDNGLTAGVAGYVPALADA